MANPATSLVYGGLTLPELVYLELIRERLDALQGDASGLESYFQGLGAEDRDAFLNYITQKSIGVHLGFSPAITYEVPQVVITAAGGQDERSVGNILRQAVVNVAGLTAAVATDFTTTDQVRHASFAQTLAVKDVAGTWPLTGIIHVGDPAAGEIMSYEGNPASGSVSIIRRGLRATPITAHAEDEPIAKEELLRIYGTDEIANHWIDVCHPNPHFVLVLSLLVRLAILKAEFQGTFAERGLVRQSTRVTDLAPHRQLYPNTVFVRSLQVECRYTIPLDEHFELIHKPEAFGTVVTPTYLDAAP